jgi:signal transduction histidine kinase
MSPPPLLRRPWFLLSAACLVPATLAVLTAYLRAQISPEDWRTWRWMLWEGGEWIILGALIPMTWFLGRRYPLRRPHLARHLLIHAAGAVALCIGWATVGLVAAHALGTVPDNLPGWLLTSLPYSVFMYFTVLGCVHAVGYLGEMRDREAQTARLAAQVAEARLAALRMQVNPHFLFNSLNALLVLIRDRDTRNAERMLELLSDNLRQVLRADARQEVPLAEELRFLDDYLAIAQIRFSDRLTVVRDIDPRLGDALVPPFILQPLVENALRHGIGESVAGGTIEIAVRLDGTDLIATVGDDGPGMPPSPPAEGVGLRNIRERIATLYGEPALLEIAPRPGGGTLARLRIPLRRATEPAPTSET